MTVGDVCQSCPSQHPYGSLHDYQEVARDFLQGRDAGLALMLDMGLGKTASVLSALEPRHLPALVVAPKRVSEEVWDVEQETWRPDLPVALAVGEATTRRRALNSGAPITVIGQQNLGDALETHIKPRTLVVDELSGYKNKSSVRWKTARAIIDEHGIKNVWGLTGTPAPNGYLDLWGQIALLDGGRRLGRNLTTFRSRYFNPGRSNRDGHIYEWIEKPETPDRIKELLQDICLAMESKGRVDVTEPHFNHLMMSLPKKVQKAYEELARELVVDLRELFDGDIHTAGNAAILTSRLSQMTAGFLYVDDAEINNYEHTLLHSEKIKALEEIMDSPRDGGVLVAYRFTAERDMILRAFPKLAHTIDEPGVVKAWNRKEIPMLVTHPASTGHGLNLQHGGHTAVWLSPTWDLEHFDQFNKRLARQGQKNDVIIHVVMAKKTIDVLMSQRLANKSEVQKDFLAFLESPV